MYKHKLASVVNIAVRNLIPREVRQVANRIRTSHQKFRWSEIINSCKFHICRYANRICWWQAFEVGQHPSNCTENVPTIYNGGLVSLPGVPNDYRVIAQTYQLLFILMTENDSKNMLMLSCFQCMPKTWCKFAVFVAAELHLWHEVMRFINLLPWAHIHRTHLGHLFGKLLIERSGNGVFGCLDLFAFVLAGKIFYMNRSMFWIFCLTHFFLWSDLVEIKI
jgi:hypothetical protein